MDDSNSNWMRRAGGLLPRIFRATFEEVEPLLQRKLLADAASFALPQQSFNRTRTALLRASGIRIDHHSLVQGPLRITGSGNPCTQLSIGCYTIITGPLHIDLGASVSIGSGVRIGHDVWLLTVGHAIGSHHLRSGASRFAPIVIEDGVWIASRVTILPGVTIGRGSVVAAGSVVSRSVAPNMLVAGVPARVVRELDPDGGEKPASTGSEPPPSMGSEPPPSIRSSA
jgi:maltose O-acetyltransferase